MASKIQEMLQKADLLEGNIFTLMSTAEQEEDPEARDFLRIICQSVLDTLNTPSEENGSGQLIPQEIVYNGKTVTLENNATFRDVFNLVSDTVVALHETPLPLRRKI